MAADDCMVDRTPTSNPGAEINRLKLAGNHRLSCTTPPPGTCYRGLVDPREWREDGGSREAMARSSG